MEMEEVVGLFVPKRRMYSHWTESISASPVSSDWQDRHHLKSDTLIEKRFGPWMAFRFQSRVRGNR